MSRDGAARAERQEDLGEFPIPADVLAGLPVTWMDDVRVRVGAALGGDRHIPSERRMIFSRVLEGNLRGNAVEENVVNRALDEPITTTRKRVANAKTRLLYDPIGVVLREVPHPENGGRGYYFGTAPIPESGDEPIEPSPPFHNYPNEEVRTKLKRIMELNAFMTERKAKALIAVFQGLKEAVETNTSVTSKYVHNKFGADLPISSIRSAFERLQSRSEEDCGFKLLKKGRGYYQPDLCSSSSKILEKDKDKLEALPVEESSELMDRVQKSFSFLEAKMEKDNRSKFEAAMRFLTLKSIAGEMLSMIDIAKALPDLHITNDMVADWIKRIRSKNSSVLGYEVVQCGVKFGLRLLENYTREESYSGKDPVDLDGDIFFESDICHQILEVAYKDSEENQANILKAVGVFFTFSSAKKGISVARFENELVASGGTKFCTPDHYIERIRGSLNKFTKGLLQLRKVKGFYYTLEIDREKYAEFLAKGIIPGTEVVEEPLVFSPGFIEKKLEEDDKKTLLDLIDRALVIEPQGSIRYILEALRETAESASSLTQKYLSRRYGDNVSGKTLAYLATISKTKYGFVLERRNGRYQPNIDKDSKGFLQNHLTISPLEALQAAELTARVDASRNKLALKRIPKSAEAFQELLSMLLEASVCGKFISNKDIAGKLASYGVVPTDIRNWLRRIKDMAPEAKYELVKINQRFGLRLIEESTPPKVPDKIIIEDVIDVSDDTYFDIERFQQIVDETYPQPPSKTQNFVSLMILAKFASERKALSLEKLNNELSAQGFPNAKGVIANLKSALHKITNDQIVIKKEGRFHYTLEINDPKKQDMVREVLDMTGRCREYLKKREVLKKLDAKISTMQEEIRSDKPISKGDIQKRLRGLATQYAQVLNGDTFDQIMEDGDDVITRAAVDVSELYASIDQIEELGAEEDIGKKYQELVGLAGFLDWDLAKIKTKEAEFGARTEHLRTLLEIASLDGKPVNIPETEDLERKFTRIKTLLVVDGAPENPDIYSIGVGRNEVITLLREILDLDQEVEAKYMILLERYDNERWKEKKLVTYQKQLALEERRLETVPDPRAGTVIQRRIFRVKAQIALLRRGEENIVKTNGEFTTTDPQMYEFVLDADDQNFEDEESGAKAKCYSIKSRATVSRLRGRMIDPEFSPGYADRAEIVELSEDEVLVAIDGDVEKVIKVKREKLEPVYGLRN